MWGWGRGGETWARRRYVSWESPVNLVSLLFYLVAVRWRAQAEKTWTTSATSDTAGGAGEAGETAVGGTGGIPGGMGDSDGAAVVLHSSGRDVELAGN